MGALAVSNVVMADQYSRLGVRFNTLIEFYNCVRMQANEHKSPEICAGGS